MLYMCVFSFALPGMAMERLLSVVYVNDYEERPRVYISVGIITVVDVLSLVCTIANIFGGFPTSVETLEPFEDDPVIRRNLSNAIRVTSNRRMLIDKHLRFYVNGLDNIASKRFN